MRLFTTVILKVATQGLGQSRGPAWQRQSVLPLNRHARVNALATGAGPSTQARALPCLHGRLGLGGCRVLRVRTTFGVVGRQKQMAEVGAGADPGLRLLLGRGHSGPHLRRRRSALVGGCGRGAASDC